MDDLFRRANKYSMLEDDVRAATQQVLVAGRVSRSDPERNAKSPGPTKAVRSKAGGTESPGKATPHASFHII